MDKTSAPANENGNVFEDPSGTSHATSDNPYDSLIDACSNDPVLSRFIAMLGV